MKLKDFFYQLGNESLSSKPPVDTSLLRPTRH